MSLFTCPWLRKGRSISPSDVARSYQSTHAGVAQQQGQTQGPLSGFENIPPLSQKQPFAFTHMLRRRFSRESKSSNDHRDSGKIVNPFSLKPKSSKSGTGLPKLEEIGSSLVSERGYDSDARNIGTPTGANYMGASSAGRGFHRMELSDLVERSQERDESERWTADQSPNNSDSRDFPLGMHYIPTPKSSLRGVPRSAREASSQRPTLNDERLRAGIGQQMGPARSLPNLTTSNQSCSPSNSTLSPVLVGPGCTDDQNCMAHWDQYLRRGQKNGMATSGSVPDLSTDALDPKKRQPGTLDMPFADPRTLHLGDFEISRRLASQTMSSGCVSHNSSSVDLLRNNSHTQFVSTSHENLQARQRSPQGQMSRHGPSSFYSHQGRHPNSNKTSPRVQFPMNHSEKANHTTQETHEKPKSQSPAANHGFTHESRFREHCDSAHSLPLSYGQPHGLSDLDYPRRVSAGWMSGGRRVGYGYSLVSGAEEAQIHNQDDDGHSSEALGWRPPPVISDTSIRNEGQAHCPPQSCRQMRPQEAVESTIQEPRPIPPPMNPKRHEVGAATFSRIKTSPQAVKNYLVPPHLRAFMGSRTNQSSSDYETGAVWIDEINSPNFCAPVIPPTTQSEHCKAPQSSHYSTHPDDASAIRWARLSQSMSAQPRALNSGEGVEGDEIGSRCESRAATRHYIGTLGDTADISNVHDAAEQSTTESPTAEQHDEDKDQASQMHPSNTRSSKWILRLSKRRASRRLPNMQQQDTSQTSTAFNECDSSSARRTNSTKSSGAEDPASAYQDCLRMPGSFDGSRWANRGSQVLWNMCTTEDDY